MIMYWDQLFEVNDIVSLNVLLKFQHKYYKLYTVTFSGKM